MTNTSDPTHSGKHLVRSTSIVAILTLLSRIFGFVRDLLVARLFGASAIADCFFVAFRIPNLLRSFVAEGALTSAFVPIFAGELKNGKEKAQQVVSLIIGFLLVVTSVLTVLGIIFAPSVVSVIAPGFMLTKYGELCVLLTRIMMPYIICVSLVAMLGGALNSVNIFGIAAMSQVAMNIILILGALVAAFFDSYTAVILLATSVLVGGIVQVIIQIPALARAGFRFKPSFKVFSPPVKELVILMLPALLGATVYQISQFINTLLASLLETGSVSWLFYADRLTQLPIGIFSIALASVLLPTLSRASADGNQSGYSKNLTDSLRYTSFCIIPLSALIFYFAQPLISIMFERGAFDSYSTARTAQAVQAYAIGLWAVSCHSMVVRGFIAKKDTVTPTLIGIATLILSLMLALLFMGELRYRPDFFIVKALEATQAILLNWLPALNLGHAGLALASSLATYFAFMLSSFLLSKKHIGLVWLPFVRSTWKSLIASILPLFFIATFKEYFPSGRWSFLVPMLTASCGFVAISYVLRAQEMQELKILLNSKLRKKTNVEK